jgi:hypothetical protein
MPKLIATTVIHGAGQGESHGGVFIVDLDRQVVVQAVDEDSENIEWFGEEGGRGLRGIAFDGDTVYIAASNRLIAYDRRFKFIDSWQNPYLINCHGICVYERNLFLASTGNDCILAFDLDKKKFHWAMRIMSEHFQFRPVTFDPMDPEGPMFINKLKLKNVEGSKGGMYIFGMNTGGLLHYNGDAINMSVQLPKGAQDARLFRKGVIFNDSHAGFLRYSGDNEGAEDRALPVPFFTESDHSPHDSSAVRMLKRGYARGLCVLSNRVVAGGCTPAGVSLYDLRENKGLLRVTFTKDTRTAINSIAAWPE